MIDDAGLDRLAAALLEELRAARRIGVFGETTPDPDCFGSQLALSRLARALHPEAKVALYADGGCPVRLRFLNGWKAFRAPREGERPVDLAIFVDGGIERCGSASVGSGRADHLCHGESGVQQERPPQRAYIRVAAAP